MIVCARNLGILCPLSFPSPLRRRSSLHPRSFARGELVTVQRESMKIPDGAALKFHQKIKDVSRLFSELLFRLSLVLWICTSPFQSESTNIFQSDVRMHDQRLCVYVRVCISQSFHDSSIFRERKIVNLKYLNLYYAKCSTMHLA